MKIVVDNHLWKQWLFDVKCESNIRFHQQEEIDKSSLSKYCVFITASISKLKNLSSLVLHHALHTRNLGPCSHIRSWSGQISGILRCYHQNSFVFHFWRFVPSQQP